MNLHNLVNALLLAVPTAGLSFFISAFVEWWLHAKTLHSADKKGTPPFESHEEHHTLHAGHAFRSVHPDEDYGLPLPTFIMSVVFISVLGLAATLLSGSWICFWVSFATAAVYFWLVSAVHRRVHEPKGGWLETTSLFRFLSRMHQVHHANEKLNFCIVAPFIADLLMRTLSTRKFSGGTMD